MGRTVRVLPALALNACGNAAGPNTANVSGPFDWTFVFDYYDGSYIYRNLSDQGRWYATIRLDRSDNPDQNSACPGTTVTTLLGDGVMHPARNSNSSARAHLSGSYKTGTCTGMSLTLELDDGRVFQFTGPLTAQEQQLTESRAFLWWDPAKGDTANPYRESATRPLLSRVLVGRWRTQMGTQSQAGLFFTRDATLQYRPDSWVDLELANQGIAVLDSMRISSTTFLARLYGHLGGGQSVTMSIPRVDSMATSGLLSRQGMRYHFEAWALALNAVSQHVTGDCILHAGTPSRVYAAFRDASGGVSCTQWDSVVVPLQTVFSDAFESGSAALWSVQSTTEPGAQPSIRQSWSLPLVGGNPDGFRRMVHTFTATTSPTFVSIFVHHVYDGVYDPRRGGAVSAIEYREDRIRLSPSTGDIGSGVVIYQNGIYHVAPLTGGVFSNSAWDRVTATLRASDFTPRPDFSAAGGAMRFGYLRSNTSRFPTELVHGIDNWRVEVVR